MPYPDKPSLSVTDEMIKQVRQIACGCKKIHLLNPKFSEQVNLLNTDYSAR